MPRIRPLILHARNRFVPADVSCQIRPRLDEKFTGLVLLWQVIDGISSKLDVGDWWILYMLGRNLEPLVYREVVAELSKKVETNESNNA